MRITRKVAVLAVVPLIAVLAFAALALRTAAGQALDAARLKTLVSLGAQAGQLTHQLQNERTAAAVILSSGAGSPAPDATQTNAYLDQTRVTDASIAQYRRLRDRLQAMPGGTNGLLRTVDHALETLPALRRQVQSGPGAELSAVTFEYRIVVADILDFRADVAEAGQASAVVASRINSSVALARAEEYASQEELAVLRARASGPLTPAGQDSIAATRSGYTDSILEFGRTADPVWPAWLDRALTGDGVIDANRLEDAVERARPGDQLPDSGGWTDAMNQRVDRLQQVEQQIDQAVSTEVTQLRDTQRAWTLGEALAVLLTVGAVVTLALRLGRPMIRELRRLRDAAHAVAHERLPAAVEALAARGALGLSTPAEFAAAAGDPVQVRGRDEIAEVGAAFNSVSREAVRIAAEQAAMRDRLGALLVNLARRGERLTGALIKALDAAERNEHDPVRLERLFALDHLASRMGRNNHSLLVLGGEASARVRGSSAPIEDVLRAAMAQIERYTRVDFGTFDPGVLITAEAVDHLVHLFAELLDNATAFSRPEHRVVTEARQLADRVVVLICDEGIGLADDQWAPVNARLASPPPVEVTGVRAMGLGVVGQLASWYGIRVELRPRPGGGTIAEVSLPVSVFRMASDTPPAAQPTAPAPLAPAPAPAPAPEPPPVPAPTARGASPVGLTAAGLPQRRPRGAEPEPASAREPAPADGEQAAAPAAGRHARRPAPDPAAPAEPVDERRDPARVSAAMAAYARGIGASRSRQVAPTSVLSDPEQKEDS
ncbi:signal transduction histidine kinase [Kitasatospora sp. MAP12-15]|uniref:sensor histidine kinase n=1 Tax=unclassified Kitasatospora TaxID=2633591 RepID=UPI002475AAA4|nr:nitrate- and nitrite sensing domain-containing protein [Kitasatospora sp. MAP12-44]MDH6114918.1 signal transduction histidine kinase [Kitasatospora sp. MAP12-44]